MIKLGPYRVGDFSGQSTPHAFEGKNIIEIFAIWIYTFPIIYFVLAVGARRGAISGHPILRALPLLVPRAMCVRLMRGASTPGSICPSMAFAIANILREPVGVPGFITFHLFVVSDMA